jgi:hypothetical protein
MAESDVTRLMREIDEAYQAAQWALNGLACGVARHDFINAREERIAACHQELATLVGRDQATALVAGVYIRGEKGSEGMSAGKQIGEEQDEQSSSGADTTHPL